MNGTTQYMLISIFVTAIIAALLFLVSNSRGENRLTPLAGLALGCVLAGILFSNNQVLGFIFFAIGIIVAVVDIYTRRKAS